MLWELGFDLKHLPVVSGVGGRAEAAAGEETTGGAEATVPQGAGDPSEQVGHSPIPGISFYHVTLYSKHVKGIT